MCLADEERGVPRAELAMPPVDAGEHMVGYLFKVGPSAAGEVLTFQELSAWCAMTGHRLSAWEAETLRALSGAYLSEHTNAADAKRPPPYQPAERTMSREEVSAGLLAMFQQLAGESAKLEAEPVAKPKVTRRASVVRRTPTQT